MEIEECLPFSRSYEALTRIWVEPSEVEYVIDDHILTKLILNDAIHFEVK